MVVHRRALKETLARTLRLLLNRRATDQSEETRESEDNLTASEQSAAS